MVNVSTIYYVEIIFRYYKGHIFKYSEPFPRWT